jgi:hypothetical protein
MLLLLVAVAVWVVLVALLLARQKVETVESALAQSPTSRVFRLHFRLLALVKTSAAPTLLRAAVAAQVAPTLAPRALLGWAEAVAAVMVVLTPKSRRPTVWLLLAQAAAEQTSALQGLAVRALLSSDIQSNQGEK